MLPSEDKIQPSDIDKHALNSDGKKPLKMEEAVHVEVAEDISPELEALLHTEPLEGLTDAQVTERTAQFGLNEIPETKANPLFKFLGYFLGPISYLLEIATILSGVFGDYIDFGILLAVLIINACIGFFEEARAESALDALKNTLAQKSRCWRNGKLVEVDSNTLVPGDIVALRLGDIIPADCRLLGVGVAGEESEGTLQIDQSALTGESLPVAKGKGVTAYSSAIVKQGQMLAVVTKTGINTFIGRAANLIAITTEEGHIQKVINNIGSFLVVVTCYLVFKEPKSKSPLSHFPSSSGNVVAYDDAPQAWVDKADQPSDSKLMHSLPLLRRIHSKHFNNNRCPFHDSMAGYAREAILKI
ncbi:hypothetical protein HDU98_006474 [Podochytrium sp. JEL0797]|nr:hypothetical protein HDU98_006474 [Podochytrium sp. JEL0797]